MKRWYPAAMATVTAEVDLWEERLHEASDCPFTCGTVALVLHDLHGLTGHDLPLELCREQTCQDARDLIEDAEAVR